MHIHSAEMQLHVRMEVFFNCLCVHMHSTKMHMCVSLKVSTQIFQELLA